MLGKKIAYNTIIAAGARIIGLALSLIIVGLITRYLGQEGFGYYTTILAFLYFFTVLADLGLYAICLRDISRPGADESKIASNAFTLRFFAGLFVFCLAGLIVSLFPYPNEVKLGVLIGVFQKHLKMYRVALAEFLARLAQLIVVLFFISQKKGFLFIVSALVISSLVSFILIFLFSQKYIKISFKFDFPFWGSFLKKSLPLGLASIFVVAYFKLDTIMLSLMKSSADVGIYGLSYKILESLLFFPAMFTGLVMPLMSKYAFSNKEKFKQITQTTLNVLLIFIVPLIIGTFFLSEKIIVLIGGPGFSHSSNVLNILIAAGAVIFLGCLFSNMIISLEKQRKLTYIYAFGALLNLSANFIFIPKYSYYGAAATTFLTEFTVTFLMVLVLFQTLKYLPCFVHLFKYVLAGLVMAGLLYFLSAWPLFVLIILGLLVYFAVLFLIGGISIKELKGFVQPSA